MIDQLRINEFSSLEEFLSGTVLLIDKPLEWTSFDVVNKIKWYVRHKYKAPKFKIGHAGTLDPLATGLLVVCVGKYTKQISELQGGTKEYTGTITLGTTTVSYDLESDPEGDYPYAHFSVQELESNASTFLGEQMQVPPIFSAKIINGKRAYESARQGEEVEMRAARVEVEAFDLTRIALPEVDFRIRCSKGTYIRTMAHEFGQRLHSGSHLSALRRTVSEPFKIGQSMTMDELLAKCDAVFGEKAS
jgi:tRNA pseudouridine55 synthase